MKDLLQKTIDIQCQASSPDVSACVIASAGSGKTKVLIDRISRLLLSGAKVESILCITFTNSAANEMKERLRKRLLSWFLNDDSANAKEIFEITGTQPDHSMLVKARNLYIEFCNKILQIKIQTLHSFCKYVLELAGKMECNDSCFDEEMRYCGGSSSILMNKIQKDALIEQSFHHVLQNKNQTIQRCIELLFECGHDYDGLIEWLRDALEKQNDMGRFMQFLVSTLGDCCSGDKHCGSYTTTDYDAIYTSTLKEFGIDDADLRVAPYEDLLYKYIASLDCSRLHDVADIVRDTQPIIADRISAWINMAIYDKIANFDSLKFLFLTRDFTVRARLFIGAEKAKQYPALSTFLRAEQHRMHALQQQLLFFENASTNGAFRVLLVAVQAEYMLLKERAKYIEYDDLVLNTISLMRSSPVAHALLCDLDVGISHILIDEAQDLSAIQWDVITELIGEFYAGEGRDGCGNRTLFIVGDFKQSIYGFHGAAPDIFYKVVELYGKKCRDVYKPWLLLHMNACFRCAPKIIELVNGVFCRCGTHSGVVCNIFGTTSCVVSDMCNSEAEKHYSLNGSTEGVVDVWDISDVACDVMGGDPHSNAFSSIATGVNAGTTHCDDCTVCTCKEQDKHTVVDWGMHVAQSVKCDVNDRHFTSDEECDKDVKIASYIAHKVADRILRGAKPQDIAVLFRKRCGVQQNLVRVLKNNGIDTQDMTCDDVTGHIYIQDMLAIAKFALSPYCEINTAILLKGPLCGVTDEELLNIAYNRDGNLFTAAQLHLQNDVVHVLQMILATYRAHPLCQDFYESLLHSNSCALCAKLLAAYPGCSSAHIAELAQKFWRMVMLFKDEQYDATLQNFVMWFDTGSAALAMGQPQFDNRSVKVSTIHGVKGMEFPIVILADAEMSENNRAENIVWQNHTLPIVGCTMIDSTGHLRNSELYEACALQADSRNAENDRLLYVGMTRAREELYVVGGWCGTRGANRDKHNWYEWLRENVT